MVVFDADRIADRATYEDGRQPAVGVEHVLVNGEPVLLDGQRTPGASRPRAPADARLAGRLGPRGGGGTVLGGSSVEMSARRGPASSGATSNSGPHRAARNRASSGSLPKASAGWYRSS